MRLGSHESHLGAHKASGLARTAPRRTRAPRMRAGSHERHPRAQNASGLARTAPRRVRAPRMRAGTHERHLRAQNASGVARTQPQRIETLRMRAGSHGRHLQGERPQTEAPRMRAGTHKRQLGYFTGIIKKVNGSKHMCSISKKIRQQNSTRNSHFRVDPLKCLFSLHLGVSKVLCFFICFTYALID